MVLVTQKVRCGIIVVRTSSRVNLCLVAAAALACSVLASLALALHAATARPRHGSCQTLITLTRRPLSVARRTRASCAQLLLLRSDFCAWRRLLLICWKLLIGVCVRDGLAASVCVYRTSAASVELRPRGWRAVAFPRHFWLHLLLRDRSGSPWIIIKNRCFIQI